jgi:hypothetical protein
VIGVEDGSDPPGTVAGYGVQELDPVAFARKWAVCSAKSKILHTQDANRHLGCGA